MNYETVDTIECLDGSSVFARVRNRQRLSAVSALRVQGNAIPELRWRVSSHKGAIGLYDRKLRIATASSAILQLELTYHICLIYLLLI